eukprot:m.25486 g.25486  ORF g.25486 m.25486 type:complete len:204 (+) comp9863_c0_seq2:231-842(+)
MEGSVITKRIVYGNTAARISPIPGSPHTHTWTLYVRSATSEPLENFVKRVAFTLHPSFKPPSRNIDSAPFEMTENGWGEFEAQIKIHFQIPALKPVTLKHLVKLYPSDYTISREDGSIVAESYDELVFSHPTSAISALLLKVPNPELKLGARDYAQLEAEQLRKLKEITSSVNQKIESTNTTIQELEAEAAALKDELARLQSQ